MDSLLKFITCGSVDDGKSTLIGHMLYDAKLLFADQKDALELDSRVGSNDGNIDYSLLLDGLMAEREQGITIDVAYRYFTTKRRSFIVADTPGHEEYTRNMAVGASFADLAVILVDASQGVLAQTRRHTRICSLMGIQHLVFAVNKMDLINYSQERFKKIKREIRILLAEYEHRSAQIIPVSATNGDNITKKSSKMPWYKGPTLLYYLETVDVSEKPTDAEFSMPVQRVCRPNHSFRGFQGQIESGSISVGDTVTVLPSHETSTVKAILEGDQSVNQSTIGHPVTIQLNTEIDVSRGCVLTKDPNLHVNTMFTATLLWMDDTKLVEGKNYLLKSGTQKVPATVLRIRHKIDVNTGREVPAREIYKNEITQCDICVSSNLVFDIFEQSKALGSLILIDRISHATSACGVITQSISRSRDLTWHTMDITKEFREHQLDQKACTIWFTGLSGSGKSTLANALEKRLAAMGKHTMLLDGDNIRLGLNKNLGFSEADRIENIRRIAEVSKLMNDAGLIVLTSFISPFVRDRRKAKEIIGEDFIEVYVSTPIEECERRDVKGLYAAAREGRIENFTGITSPYEAPQHPDIQIDTTDREVETCVDILMEFLEPRL
ncbi:MAG: adenylyl-sulfate kinase [Lachnospiraceae bacterium]|nr:adenylyl-sulfate kinase [Lachnospiraceae bacterium]